MEYKFLEQVGFKWRIKGRRLNVVDLVEGMKARGESIEETCATFQITQEELEEAIAFLVRNPEEVDNHHKLMDEWLLKYYRIT